MEKIETRVPSAELWAKVVTAVSDRAKTGHDWNGDFVRGEQLIDLEPGSVLITCDNGGSRKRPVKRVDLFVLRSSGKWTTMGKCESNEWAYELRDLAVELLSLSNEERVAKAFGKTIAKLEQDLEAISGEDDTAENRRAELRKSIEITTKVWEKFILSIEPVMESQKADPLKSISDQELIAALTSRGYIIKKEGDVE